MRKIKILRIIARLNIGGPAIHTVLLSRGLNTNKFKTVLVTGEPEQDEGDMHYLAEENGVRPIVIRQLSRRLNLFRDLSAFCKLWQIIRTQRPEIIHTHTAKAGTLGRLAGLLYRVTFRQRAEARNLKLIHTFHGHVLHSYFGRVKTTFFIWIERLLARFTDKIVAVSESVRRELIDLKISSPAKIVTIPLGLELEQYLQIEKDGRGARDYRTIGIIGRLVPIKNHSMFLEVARRVKNNPEVKQKVKFLIAGDGPLRQELVNQAERLGISEDITFLGWIRDLTKLYAELDIAALTSLNEGTPVALIEAQAAACPSVATLVGGVGDVVENGKSGFLVPSGNITEFTDALLKLLDNLDLAKTMGKYGRENARTKFSQARLVRDLEGLYEEIHS